jgi:hypothetical protein
MAIQSLSGAQAEEKAGYFWQKWKTLVKLTDRSRSDRWG